MKQFLCRAVIFDLDGVLIDSSAVVQRQWQRWLAEHDLDPNQALNVMGGQRLVELIRHVAPHLNAKDEANRLAAWEAADTDGLCEIEGASQLLTALPKGAWAVVTSGNRNTALTRLTYASLPMPDVLVTADDVTQGKPHPEPYLSAAARLGIPPAGCLVVEDAPAGVEAARAAEMRVIAVATTHRLDALEGADAIATHISDIQIVTIGDEADQRGGRHLRLSVSQVI